MKPILVEVIAILPEEWRFCLSCEAVMSQANFAEASHARGLDDYPVEWQEQFTRLAEVIFDLARRYNNCVYFQLFDPHSIQGLVKSIRYKVRRYPTFILNGREKVVGLDAQQLEQALIAAGAVEQNAGN